MNGITQSSLQTEKSHRLRALDPDMLRSLFMIAGNAQALLSCRQECLRRAFKIPRFVTSGRFN